MIELQAARRMVDDLDALVKSLEELRSVHEELRAHCGRVERDYQDLLEAEARVRRESEETAEALAELHAAYDALLGEYEASAQALRQLEKVHGTLVQERAQATDKLEAILRRLRG